jgi:hypothetical protein
MKSIPGTPRKTNTKSQSRSSSSISKDNLTSDDAGFTLVSHSRKSTGTTRSTRTETEKKTSNNHDDENESNAPTMISVTNWRFREFQQKIFPILQSITKDPAVKENPFTQQWLKALKSPHNINQLSTLRTVLKALNLADIKDYRNFIQTAPDIDKYVIFEDNKKTENGILYRIIPPSIEDTHENTIFGLDQVETNVIVDEDTNQKSVPVPSGDESITTNATHYKICYGTPTDFTDILKELWPHILKFLEQNPEHNHSKQWNKWITSGLNDTCDLSKLKEITNIETLDQLYLILRDSPAINKHFDIQWNHKIVY